MHGWTAAGVADITAEALAPVFEQADAIDVLVIGLGRDIAALPALREALVRPVSASRPWRPRPAVRTYNILLAEGRPAARRRCSHPR